MRTQEVLKELRKNESSYKDLSAQNEQDKRSIIRLQELIDTLQTKLKVYKKQIESTEELAAINLAKYRKAQHELADAAERADQAENQIAKSRATSRGLSVRRGSVSRAATPQVNIFKSILFSCELSIKFINFIFYYSKYRLVYE